MRKITKVVVIAVVAVREEYKKSIYIMCLACMCVGKGTVVESSVYKIINEQYISKWTPINAIINDYLSPIESRLLLSICHVA